jgi:hypothetical protein
MFKFRRCTSVVVWGAPRLSQAEVVISREPQSHVPAICMQYRGLGE